MARLIPKIDLPRRRRAACPAAILVLAAGMTWPVLADDPGAPAAAGGACCASLEEVRGNIDRIDAAIIALMAERGTYVAAAGHFKPNVAAVHDGARVERIVARVRELADKQKLSPEIAEATYRAMIAAFTEYEKKLVGERPAR